MEPSGTIALSTLSGLPEVQPGDSLSNMIAEAVLASSIQPEDGDVLVLAHKVVSKREGRLVQLSDVEPGAEAMELAGRLRKDPRKVELILQESRQVLRSRLPRDPGQQGLLICEHRLGFICANAGVDDSNVPGDGVVCLLPLDPDKSARGIREVLEQDLGCRIGVVITDTFGRPWRVGLMNVAIGLAGIPANVPLAGSLDHTGRELRATSPALADELAAASGLLMSKAGRVPAVWVQGLHWEESGDSAKDILRDKEEDLFL